jgi:hypothetical protein
VEDPQVRRENSSSTRNNASRQHSEHRQRPKQIDTSLRDATRQAEQVPLPLATLGSQQTKNRTGSEPDSNRS